MPARAASERDYQDTIVAAAKLLGYRVHVERPALDQRGRWRTSIQGHAGFPDIILAHDRARYTVAIELKRDDAPTALPIEQAEWVHALIAGGLRTMVVRVPSGLDALLQLLADVASTKWPE